MADLDSFPTADVGNLAHLLATDHSPRVPAQILCDFYFLIDHAG